MLRPGTCNNYLNTVVGQAEGVDITANAVHPGFIMTPLMAMRFKAQGVNITANAVHLGFIMTPLMAMRFKVEMARAKRTIRRTPPQYLFFNKQITNVRVRSI
ncbi:hypothetical protein SELMODRAFT_412037 [Selaginella moellendorffii]|uniref:Uncharacterized protein n=1 Tax=Selaginella moellendorffii TaxID=88036 RepID=D8RJU7_SELML|nr:hypothetical protein SELMODRAFT_412037 [Selaginella moellendorffii]